MFNVPQIGFIFTLVTAFMITLLTAPESRAQETDVAEQDAVVAEDKVNMDWQSIPALVKFVEQTDSSVYYAERRFGVDVWLAIKEGRIQVVYTEPGKNGLLMNGFLFGPEGNMVTQDIISDYLATNPDLVSDYVTGERLELQRSEDREQMSPSQRLWFDLSQSNYIEFGSSKAPVVYAFVDPKCQHCKKYWNAMASPYVSEGLVRLRLIPTRVIDIESENIGAAILAADDPQQAWLDQVDALFEAPQNISPLQRQRIVDNSQLMSNWQIVSVPFSIYQDAEGGVKMLRGKLDNMQILLNDLGVEQSEDIQ